MDKNQNEDQLKKEDIYVDEITKNNQEFLNQFEEKNTEKKPIDLQSTIAKYVTMIRVLSTMRIMKEDNKPVQIVDNIYIGSVGAASNKEGLCEFKITHIVCAATGIKQYFPDDFKYKSLQLLDAADQNIKQYFDETGEFIHECITNNGNVLVHCHAGISRSSSIILAYLIKYKKMRFEEALEIAKSKRQKINPNAGFVRQLKQYEIENHGEKLVTPIQEQEQSPQD